MKLNSHLWEIAANPNTPSEHLEEIVRIDRNLDRIIAKNPNISGYLILRLGFEYPQEVLSNPVFRELFKSNPDLVKEIPIETFTNLLKNEKLPDFLLDSASQKTDRRIILSVLMNPKTSLTHLVTSFEKFSQLYYEGSISKNEEKDYWDILFNIDNHVAWEQELKAEWQDEVLDYIHQIDYVDQNKYTKKYLVKILKLELDDLSAYTANYSMFDSIHKKICFNILSRFSSLLWEQQKKLYFAEKLSLAKNTKDINIFSQLLTESDKDLKIKEAILTNPHIPEKILVEILDNLVQGKHYNRLVSNASMREAFKQAKIPSKFLEKMAEQKEHECQLFVAQHPYTPTYILEKYAQSSNQKIRWSVAKNPNTPQNILSKLANTDDYEIRGAVATNPNTPIQILEMLANTSNYFFSASLSANPNLPPSVIDILSKHYSNDEDLAGNPKTPTELLSTIAKRADNYRTLINVIENPNCDAKILEYLSEDYGYQVRYQVLYNVAINPKTPSHILEKLAGDYNNEVRYFLLKNPNLTRDIFVKVFRKIFGIENYSLASLLLLLAPNTSPTFLEENANSILWIERYVIAIHPQTYLSTLQQLAKDTNRYVRAIALERCKAKIADS